IIPALRSGTVDAALCACPEHSADVACTTVRSERIVALLPISHPLGDRAGLALGELSEDVFMFVKRELSPRLHDTLVAACRRAGFEPKLRSGGLQSAWELEVLGDLDLVSLAPESVSLDLPASLSAIPVSDPGAAIETAMVARADESSPLVA